SGKVRITCQLIEAATGAHIWADRFERDMTDIFALQDDVTLAVVSAIQPKLFQAEIALTTRRRPEDLTAYDFYLRAIQQAGPMTAKGWPRHSDWSSAPWSLTLGLLVPLLWQVPVTWKTCLGAMLSI